MTRRVAAEHGGVDYLVNNAGRSIRRSLDLSYDRFHDVERTMAVNYFGAVRLTLALLPDMRAQGFGHVVNVTSWGVQKKQPKFAAYLASKAALDTWGRIAGRETYADGVTFTSVRFGLVLTPMVESVPDVHSRRSLSPEQAAARVVRALEDRPVTADQTGGRVAEVVNIVVPRLSDAWMTVTTAATRTRRRPAGSDAGRCAARRGAARRGAVEIMPVPSPSIHVSLLTARPPLR